MEINFLIKEGVYCSWCVELLKKTLKEHYPLKEIKIDLARGSVHLITDKNLSPKSMMSFLKKKGYLLYLSR